MLMRLPSFWSLPVVASCLLTLQLSAAQAQDRLVFRFQEEPPTEAPEKPEPEQPAPPPVEVDVQAREALAKAVTENPVLHGAWGTVLPDAENMMQLNVSVILDAEREKEQLLAIESLLKRITAGTDYTFEVTETEVRPFGAMLAAIQAAIEDQPTLLGSLIVDAYYTPEVGKGRQRLTLVGRIANEDQRNLIMEVARGALSEAFPTIADTTNLDNTALRVVPPSPAVGKYFFNQGTLEFADGDYEAAARSFARASLEDPLRLDYQYWRVVSVIGMGDIDRAYSQIQPLVDLRRDDVYPGEYIAVLFSLERVQGPIRQTLHDLEHRAFAEGTAR